MLRRSGGQFLIAASRCGSGSFVVGLHWSRRRGSVERVKDQPTGVDLERIDHLAWVAGRSVRLPVNLGPFESCHGHPKCAAQAPLAAFSLTGSATSPTLPAARRAAVPRRCGLESVWLRQAQTGAVTIDWSVRRYDSDGRLVGAGVVWLAGMAQVGGGDGAEPVQARLTCTTNLASDLQGCMSTGTAESPTAEEPRGSRTKVG